MSLTKRLGIGVVGLGEHMIRGHIKHLERRDDVTFISFFDPNPEAKFGLSRELASSMKASSFEAMLGDPTIEVIFIASPDQFHIDQLVQAVEANKHVFCEKPMVDTLEDGVRLRQVLRSAEEKKLIVSTCHPRRFDPPFIWLKKELQSGASKEKVGSSIEFEFNFWYHEVTDKWKKDRSLLSDHYTHEIDIFRFLFPSTYESWTARKIFDGHDKYRVEISATRSTPPARFTGYRSLKASVYQESIRIFGNKGSVVLQTNTGIMFNENTGEITTFPRMDYDARFRAVNDNFIDAILKKTAPYLTREDMLINNLTSTQLVERTETLPVNRLAPF